VDRENPPAGIKFHEKEVVREFLTIDELMTIYQKEFTLPRLALVRDMFIFAAFTGLAFKMFSNSQPSISCRITMGTIGFARHAKRLIICVISRC
jgi:hypothetical protein